MIVKEVIKALMDMPEDAKVVICAHEFPGMKGRGWAVQGIEMSNDGSTALLEGAYPVPEDALQEVPD